VSTKIRIENPKEGGRLALEEKERWLNVNSEAVAIVGKERWVGESDHDFP